MSKNDLVWPDSLWKATAEPLANLDKLPGDIDTDLLIIGAGYTGLSSALHSIGSIKDIVVIDLDRRRIERAGRCLQFMIVAVAGGI